MRDFSDGRIVYSRTPLRVSFAGGGSDYPEFYERHAGAVVGMSIDKYIYIGVRPLSAFGHEQFTLSYRRAEAVDRVDDIQHPVFRAVLACELGAARLQFSVMADLPAGVGLGSSSSFTTGLLNLVSSIKGENPTRYELATRAIHYEREVLRENVGVQDQLHASYGGMNRFDFDADGIRITPVRQSEECRKVLSDSLMLVSTGIIRRATEVVEEQIKATRESRLDDDLSDIKAMVDPTVAALELEDPETMLREMGRLLDENWNVKRGLSSKMTNADIDRIYDDAKRLGVYGGKLCGGGGGGFFLFVADPPTQARLLDRFGAQCLAISPDGYGSQIL
jgi:D-glycero-alpha-D-manno-heptose-7-phosphate kinase